VRFVSHSAQAVFIDYKNAEHFFLKVGGATVEGVGLEA
jgi:hypothetical protein